MNQTSGYELTIIVPLFNESENLVRLEKELSEFQQTALLKSCILFVNDGSNDDSLILIKNICKNNQGFYYLSFEQNCGLSSALKAGFDFTHSPYVGYIDADLQTTPADFNKLIPYLNDYGLVTGIREDRKDSLIKKRSSKIANKFRRRITHDGVEDTGCPLKIMKTDIAKQMPFFKGMHRFIPALVLLQNEKIKQIPVRHFPRLAGTAKYNLRNRMISPFIDCFAFKWMAKRYIRYQVIEQKI